MSLAEDLAFINGRAFEFWLNINPGLNAFDFTGEWPADRLRQLIWVSPEQKAQVEAGGLRLVTCGTHENEGLPITFAGTDLEDVVGACAAFLRGDDLDRYWIEQAVAERILSKHALSGANEA